MRAKTGKIDWNKELLQKLSKTGFVKRFEGIFPDLDLGSEYDRLFPPKPKKSKTGETDEGQEADK